MLQTKDRSIPGIMLRSTCKKHNAELGLPCWDLPGDRFLMPAICNDRAVRSGCTGQIKPESLGMSRAQRHKSPRQ